MYRRTATAGLMTIALMLVIAAGCTHHTVKVEPIEVKPIHMTLDVNIRVDRELDDFFAFEEEVVEYDDDVLQEEPTGPTSLGPAQETGGES